nr:FBD-associated F-box protein At5g60610-like [Coffea arabica]
MVDRISGLPDAILSHILSYLPTKLAAATSVLLLSTTWADIFASVPNIDLQYWGITLEHVRFTMFINFGLRVILLRKLDISLMGAVGNRFSLQGIRIFSSNTMVDLKVNWPLLSGLESANFGLFLAKTQGATLDGMEIRRRGLCAEAYSGLPSA